MCRFLSLDFEYDLKCPVDRANHTVRFQAFPHLRGGVRWMWSSVTRSLKSTSSPAARNAVDC